MIRIRAETDQFLISCVELPTFVKWLECLFAAIDVAIPIDERDFPRDQSIPRIQRLRWLRGQFNSHPPTSGGGEIWDSYLSTSNTASDSDGPNLNTFEIPVDVEMSADGPGIHPDGSPIRQPLSSSDQSPRRVNHHPPLFSSLASSSSTTTYHEDIEPETGKWRPRHLWSTTHDMVYAKLCYAVLLFKSPRKSNFVIFKGQRWHIDWSTGQMSRVQPPSYGEPEFWGPWQVIHADNRRI